MYKTSFKALTVSALALSSLGAFAAAANIEFPGAQITVDGESATYGAKEDRDRNGKLIFVIDNAVWGENRGPNGTSDVVSAVMNPDPFITAAASGLDIGAPSNFLFQWLLPIVPTTGPVTLKLTVGGSCTDSNNSGGCSIAPTLGGFLAEALLDGVTLISGGLAFAGAQGSSGAYASTVFTLNLPAAVTYNTLGLNLGFMGSGDGDAFSFTLGAEVLSVPVPEPGSIALVMLALAAAGVASRRRAA